MVGVEATVLDAARKDRVLPSVCTQEIVHLETVTWRVRCRACVPVGNESSFGCRESGVVWDQVVFEQESQKEFPIFEDAVGYGGVSQWEPWRDVRAHPGRLGRVVEDTRVEISADPHRSCPGEGVEKGGQVVVNSLFLLRGIGRVRRVRGDAVIW